MMGKHHHKKHSSKQKDNEKKLNIFYGIPHAHSSFSTGKGSPSDAFKYVRKKKLNYLILTDHAALLKRKTDIKDKRLTKWEIQKLYVDSAAKKHKHFTPLCGFECKIRGIGDVNIYNSETLPQQYFKSINTFISWLKEDKNRVVCINHPHESVNKLLRYPELNEFITIMEVGNGAYPNKYVRYYNRFFYFLDCGWKLGAVIGQDNHRENWGDTENLTAILSEKINNQSVIDAYKNRRTYATESSSLRVFFKINTAIMGETLSCTNGQTLNFFIGAEDKKYPIKKIQIISNSGMIIKEENFSNKNQVTLSFTYETSITQTWYSAIIYQDDDKQALLSPIFIKK